MTVDDDADCVEHVWELDELGSRGPGKGLDLASTCRRCGAVNYEPSQAAGRARPPL